MQLINSDQSNSNKCALKWGKKQLPVVPNRFSTGPVERIAHRAPSVAWNLSHSHSHTTRREMDLRVRPPILTSSGFLSTIQPDSGWISKYSRSREFDGALRLYTMAPLLSASSSDADTRRMLVPILASCFTFSTYFWNIGYVFNGKTWRWNIVLNVARNIVIWLVNDK